MVMTMISSIKRLFDQAGIKPSSGQYWGLLDGLRGLAVAAVVLYQSERAEGLEMRGELYCFRGNRSSNVLCPVRLSDFVSAAQSQK